VHAWYLETPKLPVGHPGLRLAHMTDLHVGRVTPEARLVAAVDAVNALQPDVVCLTGDYVSHSLRYLKRLERALSRLEAPAYAVYGNHDHWNGAAEVGRALEQAGVRMLVNATAQLSVRGASWRLVGLDDPVTRNHDVSAAFGAVDPSEPLVVLSHLAEATHAFAAFSPLLVLSGHTHGGQVRTGGLVDHLLRRLGHAYIIGWYTVDRVPVYVNRGLGAAVFPWRTHHAAPEVASIELAPYGADEAPIPSDSRVSRRKPFDKSGVLEE